MSFDTIMNLDAIDLVAKNGRYFLIDANYCKPTALSLSAFDVLRALKRGETIDAVRQRHGEETVTAVLTQLETLQQRGVISAQRRDFRAEAQAFLDALETKEPAAIEGVFMVAQGCNLACRYCYGGTSGTFGQRGLMSGDTAERCLRYFLSINGSNRFQKVVLLGGEPLLNLKVIRRLIELWEEWRPGYPGRELFFSMTTNGTLLTPEVVHFLKEKRVGTTVSLDGPRGMHDANRVTIRKRGSFDRVMAGIELLRRHEVPFSIRTTMTRQTDVGRLHEFFAENDFNLEYLTPVDFPQLERRADYQLDVEDFRRLTAEQQRLMCEGCEEIKAQKPDSFKARQLSMAFQNLRNYETKFPFKCTAGWSILAFDIDGTIYPCQRFVGHRAYALGDVASGGIDPKKSVAMYRRFLDASGGCNSCWAVQLCRRRCFVQKAGEDGSFKPIPRQICDVYRDNYAASMAFAEDLRRHASKHEATFKDALTRFDTDRLMREYWANERASEDDGNGS